MKRLISFLVIIPILLLSIGCATQRVVKTDKDGNKTEYVTRAIFSKAAFDGIAVDKTTKTTSQLLGVKAYNSESQADQLINLFQSLFEAGLKAGAKTVVP